MRGISWSRAAVPALAACLALLLSAGGARAAVIPDSCGAWSTVNSAATANIALPDTAATYWTTGFKYRRGLRLTVSGEYLTARYMSFNVYDEGGGSFTVPDPARRGGTIGSSLPDFRIRPRAGSVNPYTDPAGPRARKRFRVVLERNPSSARANSMPIIPRQGQHASRKEYLILRAYRLGARGTLPRVSWRVGNGRVHRVRTCGSPGGSSARPNGNPGSCVGGVCTGNVEFRRLSASVTNTQFPNADTAYVTARVSPPAGDDVVVVRGLAPTAPTGRRPVGGWPNPSFQVRYWSMCNTVLRSPFPAVVNGSGASTSLGCRNNDDTARTSDDRYTYVLAREDQRAEVDRIRGSRPELTFLPFSEDYPAVDHMLVLRNMLPADFANSTFAVPQPGTPDETRAAMGDYYPTGGVCSLTTLEQSGPEACLPP
jgi:hypothetical protein